MILSAIRVLFSRGTKVKMVLVLVGYIVVSLFDMAGIVALVPLMALLTMPSSSHATGVTSIIWQALGRPSNAQYALTVAIIVATAFTLKAVFGTFFRWWSLKFLAEQQSETSAKIFKAYLDAPFDEHRRTSSSKIINSVVWLSQTAFTGVGAGISLLGEIFTVASVMITLLLLNPLVAVFVGGLFTLVGGGFQFVIRKRSKHVSEQVLVQQERSTKAVLHGVGGVKEIILRNNPGPFLAAYGEADQAKNDATRVKLFYSDLPKYFLEVLLVGGIAGVSAYLFSTGGSSQMIGTLAIFGAAGFRLLPSVTRMLASLNGLLQSRPAIVELAHESQRLASIRRHSGTSGTVNYSGDVVIQGVGYEYQPGLPVLSDISLTIARGTSLALVGASGAGKSTLVDLLLGLQEPTVGSISCGNKNIHESLVDWQTGIGYVPQDVFLMDASLRENIVFDVNHEEIDEELLARTIRLAQLTDLVEASPSGLDLIVGDRGIRLSGGQRQRIAIARALYRKPRVLILDEATSALDNETERQITQTIEGLSGEITVIVVAHRLSTVKGCSQFLVLENGKADAVGTLAEVRENSKVFANLAQLAAI